MNININISVIIACYNVEKYLVQCLDSIINQTYKNLEIIAVNDGSTDSTLSILKQYQSQDARIIVIDQKNQGLSGARNSGIRIGKQVNIDQLAVKSIFELFFMNKIISSIHCRRTINNEIPPKSHRYFYSFIINSVCKI